MVFPAGTGWAGLAAQQIVSLYWPVALYLLIVLCLQAFFVAIKFLSYNPPNTFKKEKKKRKETFTLKKKKNLQSMNQSSHTLEY